MKILSLLLLLTALSACNNVSNIRLGHTITNGICSGYVYDKLNNNEAYLTNLTCLGNPMKPRIVEITDWEIQ